MDWNDVQTSLFLPCGFFLRVNSVTGVTVDGFEFESRWQVNDQFAIGLNFAFIDSNFNGDEPGLGAFEGDPMQDVPEFEGAVFADWQFAFGSGWNGLFHIDYSHRGESYSDFARLGDGVTRDPLSYRGELSLLTTTLHSLQFALCSVKITTSLGYSLSLANASALSPPLALWLIAIAANCA